MLLRAEKGSARADRLGVDRGWPLGQRPKRAAAMRLVVVLLVLFFIAFAIELIFIVGTLK